MKKLLPVIMTAAVFAGCTANEGTAVTETAGRTAAAVSVTAKTTTTVTTEISEETTSEMSAVAEKTKEYSDDVRKAARTFAKLVYRELENNKTAEDPTFLVPISCDREIPETGFDHDAFEADIFFIDTDFDGVPELFAGGHGAMGTGRYSVFTADGETYGNGRFAHNFCNFSIADDCMYVSSGSIHSWGWTKLCEGLPSIYFNGFWTETGTNDLYITFADGTEQTLTGLTFDEAKALYPKYLGVEYDDLRSVGEDEDIPFTYARGVLEVPDPENYTEEDIYDCLAELLAEYEKAAAGAEEASPINAELGVNGDGTLNEVFTERLLELATPDVPVWVSIFPALWDFDGDGIPEMIITYHNGGQGRMPCEVYNSETLEQIGEFRGFCRDGYTRFINDGECTVIYNYYEHSVHGRFESVERFSLNDGKLVSRSEIKRNWSQTRGELKPRLEYWQADSSADERSYEDTTAEYYGGDVCTGYDEKNYTDIKKAAETAVESYNNYVKAQALAEESTDRVLLAGNKNQYVFLQNKEGFYFIDENGERTVLKEGWAYYDLYKLWDDVIVSNDPGNLAVCDVYIISDGKPVFVPEISGKGMHLDYSHLYNGCYELTHSTYDGQTDVNGKPVGFHTFKKYQLYRDKNGFHEYGSITVPLNEFLALYGEDIKPLSEELAAEDTELYEVLYRGDGCFILNCRKTIFLDDEKSQPADMYYAENITVKPLTDGGFSEICRDRGTYKTALIPEIAVYPETYRTEDAEWSKYIVY